MMMPTLHTIVSRQLNRHKGETIVDQEWSDLSIEFLQRTVTLADYQIRL